MSITDNIIDLCAAIDAGDDSLLPILADALDEAGDGRAAGLRRAIRPCGNRKTVWNYGVSFVRQSDIATGHTDPEWAKSAVPDHVFDRLTGHTPVGRGGGNSSVVVRRYRRLSAAYLALAEALSESPTAIATAIAAR